MEIGDHGKGDHYVIVDGVMWITPEEEAAIRTIKDLYDVGSQRTMGDES